jgi:hypothetical protein
MHWCKQGIQTICLEPNDSLEDFTADVTSAVNTAKTAFQQSIVGTLQESKSLINSETTSWANDIDPKLAELQGSELRPVYELVQDNNTAVNTSDFYSSSDANVVNLEDLGNEFDGIETTVSEYLKNAKVVSEEATSESKSVMDYFTDDAVSQYHDFYSKYLDEVIQAEEDYNATNGNFESDVESAAASITAKAQRDEDMIQLLATGSGTSLDAISATLGEEISTLQTDINTVFSSANTNFDVLVPFFLNREDEVKEEAMRVVSGSKTSSALSDAKSTLYASDATLASEMDRVKSTGVSDMNTIMTDADTLQGVMKTDAERLETRTTPRLQVMRTGPGSKKEMDDLISPLRETLSEVKDDGLEEAANAISDLDYEYDHAKGVLNEAGDSIQERASLQGARHRKTFAEAKEDLKRYDAEKYGPGKMVMNDAYEKGVNDLEAMNTSAETVLAGIVQMLAAADAYVEGGLVSDPQVLLDGLVNTTLTNADNAILLLQDWVTTAPATEAAIQLEISTAEGFFESQKNSTDSEMKQDLQRAASYVAAVQRNASDQLELTTQHAEEVLSNSYSLDEIPQSHHLDDVENGLEQAFGSLENDLMPLAKHVEHVLKNNSDYAHGLYQFEKERSAKVVDSVLHSTKNHAEALSEAVHGVIVRMNQLRQFMDTRTKYGLLGIEHDWHQTMLDIKDGSHFVESDANKIEDEATVAGSAGEQLAASISSARASFNHRIDLVTEALKNHVDSETEHLADQAAAVTGPAEKEADDNIAAVAGEYLSAIAEAGGDAAVMFEAMADKVQTDAEHDQEQAEEDVTYLDQVYDDLIANQLLSASATRVYESNLKSVESEEETLSGKPAADVAQLYTDLMHKADNLEGGIHGGIGESITEIDQKADETSGGIASSVYQFASSTEDQINDVDGHANSAQHHAHTEAAKIYQDVLQALQTTAQQTEDLRSEAHGDAVAANATLASTRVLLSAARDAVLQAGDEWGNQTAHQLGHLHDLSGDLHHLHRSIIGRISGDTRPFLSEISAIHSDIMTSMIAKSGQIDALEDAQSVADDKSFSAWKDAEVDTDLAQKAYNEAWNLYDTRKNITVQKVFDTVAHMNNSIAALNESVKSMANHDAAVLIGLLSGMDNMVANATIALNDTAERQDAYDADLLRVANMEANDVHKKWITDNAEKAALVDFQATSILHWMHQFISRDLKFKEKVRAKFETVNATLADQMQGAMDAAHGIITTEKDQFQGARNQFENGLSEQQEWLKDMVGKVRLSAEDAFAYMQASKGTEGQEGDNVVQETLQMENKIRSSMNPDGGASLWSALSNLRLRMKEAIYLGQRSQLAGRLHTYFQDLRARSTTRPRSLMGLLVV